MTDLRAKMNGRQEKPSPQEAVLRCRGLGFSWRRERILDHLDFSLFRGDFAVITGANGSGKTTLMRLILGEIAAEEGQVLLFGEEVGHFSSWSRLAYLSQNAIDKNASFPATASEIVAAHLYGRKRRERLSRNKGRDLVQEALAWVGMASEAEAMIGELSGGQQQRVLMAAMIAARPELMLLDEPAAGIDSENRLVLYRLLRHMRDELDISILMITHDQMVAESFANRVFCLEGGTLLELSPEQMEAEARHRHRHPHFPAAEEKESENRCCWRSCDGRDCGGAGDA